MIVKPFRLSLPGTHHLTELGTGGLSHSTTHSHSLRN